MGKLSGTIISLLVLAIGVVIRLPWRSLDVLGRLATMLDSPGIFDRLIDFITAHTWLAVDVGPWILMAASLASLGAIHFKLLRRIGSEIGSVIRRDEQAAPAPSPQPEPPRQSGYEDDDYNALMSQFESTHPYDVPLKLKIIDELVGFMRADVAPLVRALDALPKLWKQYVREDNADRLVGLISNLLRDHGRITQRLDEYKFLNMKYDDIEQILHQDYEMDLYQSLKGFSDAVTRFKSGTNAETMISLLGPFAEQMSRSCSLTSMWAESVAKTLLLRRKWLVRQSNAGD